MSHSFRAVLLALAFGLAWEGACAQSSASPAPDSMHSDDVQSSDEAQHASDPAPVWYRTRHRLSVWMGRSNNASRLLGRIREAEFRIVGLRYKRRLSSSSESEESPSYVAFYTADLIPWARLSVPGSARPKLITTEGDPIPRSDLSTTGFGVAPLGIQVNMRLFPRVQPFFGGSTGILYFVDSIPDRRGKQFNFTLDFGAGVQITVADHLHLTLGYRYHHLSNGYRGRINPGVDANLFYISTAVGL